MRCQFQFEFTPHCTEKIHFPDNIRMEVIISHLCQRTRAANAKSRPAWSSNNEFGCRTLPQEIYFLLDFYKQLCNKKMATLSAGFEIVELLKALWRNENSNFSRLCAALRFSTIYSF